MLFLGRLTAINHSYFEKLSSLVRVEASYVLVCTKDQQRICDT